VFKTAHTHVQNGPTQVQNGPQLLEVRFLLLRVYCMKEVHRVTVLTYYFKIRKNSQIEKKN